MINLKSSTRKHWGIHINSQSNLKKFVSSCFGFNPPEPLDFLKNQKGALFSDSALARYIDEEEKHDRKTLTEDTDQSLLSMSSGERKKRLLQYLLGQELNFLLLVNPFDNMDVASQAVLKSKLYELAKYIHLVELAGRKNDFLWDVLTDYALLEGSNLFTFPNRDAFLEAISRKVSKFTKTIPAPLKPGSNLPDSLVEFKGISVSFEGRKVLHDINWTIKKGEFWNLVGPNGSGKSTLLKMITGDSHKGYGQDVTIFGHQKGNGESVWGLKKHIGFFTPSMTDRFRGYHTVENMLISGLHDSVGLYVKPSDEEKSLALDWLKLLGLTNKKNSYFHELATTEKNLLMTARAMVKHPPLLILDEPTVGLDDTSAQFFVALINKIAEESTSAIVFVSHRKEPGLYPQKVFELRPGENGSIGKIRYNP